MSPVASAAPVRDECERSYEPWDSRTVHFHLWLKITSTLGAPYAICYPWKSISVSMIAIQMSVWTTANNKETAEYSHHVNSVSLHFSY